MDGNTSNVRGIARFEVLTAVVRNVAIFWDTALCSPYVTGHFGGKFHLHLQGRKSAEPETTGWTELYAARRFPAHLIFDPEDGDETLLSNVGSHTGYTALYHRTWQHSRIPSRANRGDDDDGVMNMLKTSRLWYNGGTW
jgi:hypothetical protein